MPKPSCHNSLHIVLDRSKDIDELCTLLLVGATFLSDVVTLRERLQSNLQLELQGLQEKEEKEAVELLMAENSSRLEKKAIDDGELGYFEAAVAAVPIVEPRLHFVQEEPQKGHRRNERRVDSSR